MKMTGSQLFAALMMITLLMATGTGFAQQGGAGAGGGGYQAPPSAPMNVDDKMVSHFARCAPGRAKRRRVVPGSRGRVRVRPQWRRGVAPKPRRQYAKRIRHAVKPFVGAVVPGGPTGSRARLRPQGEPGHKEAVALRESRRRRNDPTGITSADATHLQYLDVAFHAGCPFARCADQRRQDR